MGAICGIAHLKRTPGAAISCSTVQDALAPYGRHALGMWDGGDVALAARSARLLPEDIHDRQPLRAANDRFVLVAELRLDNREELRHLLNISGRDMEGMADVDMLLAAYLRWEHDTPEHLLGDFAFAVWDKQQRTLFMARDQMGRSPLFYHQGKDWFGFATMPAGLLALPDVPTAPDEERLRDLLIVMPDHSDHSYFAGVRRILPGHKAVLQADGTLRSERYWEPPIDERIVYKSDDDYVDAFLEKLEEAVRCRLRTTGGIASQISAGFDSATVTSVAARILQQDGKSMHAYTAVPYPAGMPAMSKRVLDEGPLAAQVAALFPNVRHHLIRTEQNSIMPMLERMYSLYNRPAKNVVNMIWDMEIAQQAAQQGATTVLNGALGNFSISYHGEHVLNSFFGERRYRELAQELRSQLSDKPLRRQLSVVYNLLMPALPIALQSGLDQLRNSLQKHSPLSEGVNPEVLSDPAYLAYLRNLGRSPNMTQVHLESRKWRQRLLLRHDFAEYGKGTLALAGVDVRDPSVDLRLIRYCQAIPVEQFQHGGTDRWLLRRALTRYWPQTMIDSRIKGLQGADQYYRVKQEQNALSHQINMLHDLPLACKLLDLQTLTQQLSDMANAGQHNPDIQFSSSFKLLRLIAAGNFLQRASICQ